MPQSPTTNMLLIQPSENGDSGVWDTLLSTLFLLIDAHDHSTGKGVTVKTAGISINADLSYSSSGNFYALKDVKALDFQPSTAASMTSYAGALFVNSSDSNNLYFRTQSGTNVRITNGTQLDITVAGGIGGDYTAVGAEVAFSDANKEYAFKQDGAPKPWAALRSGPLRVAELDTTDSVYVEIATPAALAGTYTITLPTAAPAATSILQMTSAGVVSASNAIADDIVMAAGEHVTVSGAGEFKHGDKVLHINVCSGETSTAGVALFSDATTVYAVESAGASGVWMVPIPLTSGDRIKSITYFHQRAAGTMQFTFITSNVTTGAGSLVNTVSVAAGTTYASSTTSALTTTLNSTTTANPMIRWLTGGINDRWYGALVTYDRP